MQSDESKLITGNRSLFIKIVKKKSKFYLIFDNNLLANSLLLLYNILDILYIVFLIGGIRC
jgi:hypothetical protein